jgi:CRP/FNR family transcriptional regulator, cyclic AMP receptor protein
MTFAEACEIVRHWGWLSHTPQAFQQAVLDRCLLQEFKSGTSIYMVGDPPGGMFGLASGHLSVLAGPGARLPYIVKPGTWLGVTSALTGQPRRISLSVTRQTAVLHLPLTSIHEIVTQNPRACRLFALVTVGHIDLAMGASDDLMIRDHMKRFIAILLRLGGCRLTTQPASAPIEVDVNQKDLAGMSNVARTTAGAILRKLEASGHVDLSYRHIRILAPDALRTMLSD